MTRSIEEKARDGYNRLWAARGGIFAGEKVYTWEEIRKDPVLLALWCEKVAQVEADPCAFLADPDRANFARGVLDSVDHTRT
jgi:hypothetical protein